MEGGGVGDIFGAVGGGVFGCFFCLLGPLLFAFWIWMLVDCIQHEPSGTEKIVWILIIIFTGVIGAAIYFFVRRGKNRAGEPGVFGLDKPK